MSKKKHYDYDCCYPSCYPSYGGYSGGMGCGCNYSNIWSLLILILIVLKFSKGDWGKDDHHGLIDNGILFIIALFLLIYCGCGKGYGGYGGGY